MIMLIDVHSGLSLLFFDVGLWWLLGFGFQSRILVFGCLQGVLDGYLCFGCFRCVMMYGEVPG